MADQRQRGASSQASPTGSCFITHLQQVHCTNIAYVVLALKNPPHVINKLGVFHSFIPAKRARQKKGRFFAGPISIDPMSQFLFDIMSQFRFIASIVTSLLGFLVWVCLRSPWEKTRTLRLRSHTKREL
jgi:hypothetical protein